MKTQLKELLTRFQSSGSLPNRGIGQRTIMQKGLNRNTGKRQRMHSNPVHSVMNKRIIH